MVEFLCIDQLRKSVVLFQSNILFLASDCPYMFKCLQIEILSGIWTWLVSITKQTFYTCLKIHFVLLLVVYHKFKVGNTFSHNEFRLGNSLSHNRCGEILFHFKTSICLLLLLQFSNCTGHSVHLLRSPSSPSLL